MKKQKRVTSSDIRELLNVSRETANQYFKKLIDKGIIENEELDLLHIMYFGVHKNMYFNDKILSDYRQAIVR